MDDGPSTAAFLASVLPPPAESRYTVTPEVVRTLHRSLYSQLLADLPAAYLLPRAAAPSSQHALNYLEQSGWKLVEAQKRGAQESLSQTGKGKMSVDGEGPGESLGPEYGEDRRGMPCGHVFKKGEAVYRCR